MSEMIERVAKAIRDEDFTMRTGTADSDVNCIWLGYQHKARAAIEAMREPTEEMLGNYENASFIWPLMIDVALKEFGK